MFPFRLLSHPYYKFLSFPPVPRLTHFQSILLRVLIGSTSKLGTGVNVQERLVAIHHLDIPWKPSDIVQREGRLIRQGNTNDKVFRFRYITAGTFDAYSWQLLENKQRFISQFMSNNLLCRNVCNGEYERRPSRSRIRP